MDFQERMQMMKFGYGFNKSPMGFDCSNYQISGTATPDKRKSKSVRRINHQWSALGLSYWCALEGYAWPLPILSNLPPTISGVGEKGCLGKNIVKTCHRFKESRENGFGGNVYRRQLCSGQKGGSRVGKTKRGKGTKIMAVVDGNGFPLAVSTYSASPHEVTLVEETISKRFIRSKPKRIIGDKAYDSDKLDLSLKRKGIKMIAPNRSNKKIKTQDGRELRRYRKRWKVERLFAWIQNFRRCQTRWDYHDINYEGFVQLACIVILLRNYF